MKTPKECVEYIDKKFQEAYDKNLSRFSIEWGKWSREMNLETRKRIEDNDPESEKLKHVFGYWVVRSQILELYFNYNFLRKTKIKKLAIEATQIKRIIYEKEKTQR